MVQAVSARWLRFSAMVAAGMAIVAVAACAADSIDSVASSATFDVGTTASHSIVVGSLTREYILHVPAHRPTTSSGTVLAYPLIIVLHGSSADGEDIRATTNMDSVSEANRTIVAYPNGVRGAGGLFPSDWNAGNCCGAASRENIDDVGFIKAMIAQLATSLPIDTRRIYVAGFSDGGRMAYRLACELSSQIAAIAVVSGSLRESDCEPARAVPVIAIHGTDDDIVPYNEDPDTPPALEMTGAAATLPPSVQFWISANACTGGTTSAFSSRVDRTTFSACTADVAFYSVAGGGHEWPVFVDSASDDPGETFSATPLIASFFRRRVLK